MILHKSVRTAVFALFLVANPAYFAACAGEENGDSFTYGESDMLELMDGLNSTEWLVDGYALELSLTQGTGASASFSLPDAGNSPSFVRSAHACGGRSFVKSAAACIDWTDLPVLGTLRIFEQVGAEERTLIDEIPVDGNITVMSLNLDHAEVNLSLNNGSAYLSWDEELGGEFVFEQLKADGLGADGRSIDIEYPADR